jgi:THO complex subunit 2
MAAEEQERVASEEAEKRLKATLAAKRDPSITQSRIASPVVGEGNSSSEAPATTADSKPNTQEVKSSEDVVMDNGDSQASAVSPVPEVRVERLISSPCDLCFSHLLDFFVFVFRAHGYLK